jgi:hypothetical protein
MITRLAETSRDDAFGALLPVQIHDAPPASSTVMALRTWAARAMAVRVVTIFMITAYCWVLVSALNACAARGLASKAAARSGGAEGDHHGYSTFLSVAVTEGTQNSE